MLARTQRIQQQSSFARQSADKSLHIANFRYNFQAEKTDWERVQSQGTAEGATPVTAQAQELIGQANLESVVKSATEGARG